MTGKTITILLVLVLFSALLASSNAAGRRRPARPGVRPVKLGYGRPARPGARLAKPGRGRPVRPGARPAKPGRGRPARPGAGNLGAVFNVLNFGAKTGKAYSTQAFIRAWRAACDFNGKARVFVPAGDFTIAETIFEGPCKNPTPTFQLIGNVKAVPDVSEYTSQGWITFDTVNGLTITGGGTIDGQGQFVWKYNDCKKNPSCIKLPASVKFNNVKNANIKGINFLNSMGFHMHITNSYFVRVHSTKFTAPDESPNTDGIHISKSTTVKVSRSIIRTGDDCVSMGQGCLNITVNQVTCGPGHGISVGSLGKYDNELDVRGLIVKNCTLVGTTNGVRIKTYAATDPSAAAGMLFSGIRMINVKNPIIIDQNYGRKNGGPSKVKIVDVVYENIYGTSTSPVAIQLTCSSSVPCRNVRFSNINLRPVAGNFGLKSQCINAKPQSIGFQVPQLCK